MITEKERRNAVYNSSKESIKDRNKRMEEWRDEIVTGYGCKCAVCGWHIDDRQIVAKKSRSFGLDVHHIVTVKNGGSESWDNLIPLCPNCHREAHLYGRGHEYFNEFIKTKEQAEADKANRKKEASRRILEALHGEC